MRILAASLLVIAAWAAPSPAPAAPPGRVDLSVYAGYETYDMSDVEQVVGLERSLNPTFRGNPDDVKHGAGLGGGLRFWRSDRAALAVEYTHLAASGRGAATYLGTAYTGELSVPAEAVTLTAEYFLLQRSRVGLGLGAGLGYYFSNGKLSFTPPVPQPSATVEGSGFGLHGAGLAEIALAGPLRLSLEAGYRWARTSDVSIEGSRYELPDGSNARIDWSGLLTRAGITVQLTGL